MRKNVILIIIAVLVIFVGCAAAYTFLIPHYKTIEMNGYSFEVPISDSNVTKHDANYKTYDDASNKLVIKSYAIYDLNITNMSGVQDIGYQLRDNMGENLSYENFTIYKKDGNYTFFDYNPFQFIIITCNNLDMMKHLLKSMNKTGYFSTLGDTSIDLSTITNNTNDSNNTTDTVQTTTNTNKSTSSSSKKSSSKSSESNSYSSEDDYFVVNPETGKREYGPAHPNYGTPNDYLQEEHSN